MNIIRRMEQQKRIRNMIPLTVMEAQVMMSRRLFLNQIIQLRREFALPPIFYSGKAKRKHVIDRYTELLSRAGNILGSRTESEDFIRATLDSAAMDAILGQ